MRREGSSEGKPADPSRSPQAPPGHGPQEGRVPFILRKPEEGRGAAGKGCGLPGGDNDRVGLLPAQLGQPLERVLGEEEESGEHHPPSHQGQHGGLGLRQGGEQWGRDREMELKGVRGGEKTKSQRGDGEGGHKGDRAGRDGAGEAGPRQGEGSWVRWGRGETGRGRIPEREQEKASRREGGR